MSVQRIAFICSGNICRSPMAEAIARQMVASQQLAAEFCSAGTLGIQGVPADPLAIAALAECGIDLTQHECQGVEAGELVRLDAIVVMAEQHATTVTALVPECEPRVVRLWEHTHDAGRLNEIRDPVGETLEVFLTCRDDIRECLSNWLPGYLGLVE